MTKHEFMRELEKMLLKIPENERKDALQYYNDYFADAGIDDDMLVPSSIGTPVQVADNIIREAMYGDVGQKTENVQDEMMAKTSSNNDYNHQGPYYKSYNNTQRGTNNQADRKNSDNSRTILAVVLIIVLSPFWISILATVGGVLFGIFAALLGMVVGFGIAGIALVVAAFMASQVAGGILLAGTGLLLTSLAILMVILLILFCVKLIPWCVVGIISLCKWIFGRKEQK